MVVPGHDSSSADVDAAAVIDIVVAVVKVVEVVVLVVEVLEAAEVAVVNGAAEQQLRATTH